MLAGAARTFDEPKLDGLAHALQCGAILGREHPDDVELAVAGLVHDISDAVTPDDHTDHDRRGALLVKGLFGARVAQLVGAHVLAKRYLVTTEPSYRSGSATGASRPSPSRAGSSARPSSNRSPPIPISTRSSCSAAPTNARRIPRRSCPASTRGARPRIDRASAEPRRRYRGRHTKQPASLVSVHTPSAAIVASTPRSDVLQQHRPVEARGQVPLVERAHAVDVRNDGLRIRYVEHALQMLEREHAEALRQDRFGRLDRKSFRAPLRQAPRRGLAYDVAEHLSNERAHRGQVRVAVEDDEQRPVGMQHARDLAERGVDIGYVIEHVRGEHDVERVRAKRDRLGVADQRRCEGKGLGSHAGRQVHSERAGRRFDLAHGREIATGTAPDVEHARAGSPLRPVEDPAPDVDRVALIAVETRPSKERR